MNTKWLKTRQTKYAAYLTVYVVVILAVVVIANMLADHYNKRYDGTANKFYSLSDQTLKIVKQLKQPATITYFDLTSRFTEPSSGAGSMSPKDLLDRYANISPKVRVQMIDPDKNPEMARAAGVKTYGTAVVQVGARKEDAKSLSEEGITGALIRVTKTGTRTVCFTTGSGEPQIDDTDATGLSFFKQILAKDGYGAKSISLLQKPDVPNDCSVLVVAGPTSDYRQSEADSVKKYVEGGGRALFLLQPPLNVGQTHIAENAPLANLLQSWGVTLDKNLVLDLNPIEGLGPEAVAVSSYPTQAIVNDMKRSTSVFPVTRSLEIKNGDKTTIDKLIEASDSVIATTKLSGTVTAQDVSDPKNKKGPMVIAAAGEYNNGQPNKGRFAVYGSAQWCTNFFIRFKGNYDLALNTVNWLSSSEDLISIHPKEQENRRVTMTATQLRWVKTTSQALLPLSILLIGLLVWARRRGDAFRAKIKPAAKPKESTT